MLWSVPDARLCQLNKTDPIAAMNAVKGAILRGVDILPNLKDKTSTSGRLNVFKAYQQLRRGFGQPLGDYDVLQFFPNPTDKTLNVKLQLPDVVTADLVVANAIGQIVLRKKIETADLEKSLLTIDTRLFASGMYFLTVQTDKFEVVRKFVVVKK